MPTQFPTPRNSCCQVEVRRPHVLFALLITPYCSGLSILTPSLSISQEYNYLSVTRTRSLSVGVSQNISSARGIFTHLRSHRRTYRLCNKKKLKVITEAHQATPYMQALSSLSLSLSLTLKCNSLSPSHTFFLLLSFYKLRRLLFYDSRQLWNATIVQLRFVIGFKHLNFKYYVTSLTGKKQFSALKCYACKGKSFCTHLDVPNFVLFYQDICAKLLRCYLFLACCYVWYSVLGRPLTNVPHPPKN